MPFTCRYGDEQFRYAVCYRPTSRQKILIHIHPNGAVQVDAPSGAANAAVKEAVQKRARWVITQLEQMREQQREVLPRRYVSGESHFYQGRRYEETLGKLFAPRAYRAEPAPGKGPSGLHRLCDRA